ncbi:calcium permeable stress-gated cation channel 1 [Anthonomus grandis grandis]|uniref:calcium permeable stress-gated cation channel 1 n=1 Tax=Anthonomus grandis grandis TaxID=2921223 RepID=UPI0021652551|nr:calcium permeable stress-gated cation channel 1 [Anthonomus grandis grandis]
MVQHSDDDTCLTVRKNTTVITNIYEGIPETFILNVICWILLILLFAILRNRAWDYGRLALVHTQKWTQLFYKNTDDAVAVEENNPDVSLVPDTGCLWFVSLFKITKSKIYARCGPDASHYLSFQKHLLILFTVISIFSIAVILPVNFQGTLEGNSTTFGHTTLSNLGPSSNLLWVHVVASLCMAPLTIMIMKKCSGKTPSASALSSRTLMVTNIAKQHRNIEDIKNYFTVRYPQVEVLDVQLTYKVKHLVKLENERSKVIEAKLYCTENCHRNAQIKVQPKGCICCYPCNTMDALEYYTREEQRLNELVLSERRTALAAPLGIAFVTVAGDDMAQYVIKSFEPGTLRNWHIVQAPTPADINWENLEISYRNWYSKAIFINFIVFLLFFFLTTPIIVLNVFNQINQAHGDILNKLSPLISQFFPILLLLSVSALMPVIVAYSDEWMSHWTKSKQNFSVMFKTFCFLLFMVLILPSLGLTSAQAFVEWPLQNNTKVRWSCIFLADKGAFFVNYVITSALIGTALELLRFPELAMYALRLSFIKSEAEKPSIRKEILSEFQFGIHYAWTLLIFTISTVYSLSCPLITPFGLLYLCLKHLVDKYNIYYVYKPIAMSTEGQQIHAGAVRMVRVAILLCQIILTAFFFIRDSGGLNAMTYVMFIGICVTVTCFFFLSPFPTCKSVTSVKSHLPALREQYIAPVLLSSSNINKNSIIDSSSPVIYGSAGPSIIIPETGSSNA